jgi:hypothetical protein
VGRVTAEGNGQTSEVLLVFVTHAHDVSISLRNGMTEIQEYHSGLWSSLRPAFGQFADDSTEILTS